MNDSPRWTRRHFLASSVVGGAVAGATTLLSHTNTGNAQSPGTDEMPAMSGSDHTAGHGGNHMVGTVDHTRNGFTPLQLATEFDYGIVSTLADGRTLREFTINAIDKEIEIAPGIFFPAWTYNGRVPGPTLRVTEGDRVRITFGNGSEHPHTLHFHGIHPDIMDGVGGYGAGEIAPGGSTVYEFDALPFGFHPYHCHALPLKRHIHKGLYGTWIIDPKQGRPPAREFVMTMNGFDTNFDNENEVYAVNSIAFAYANEPLRVKRGELVRVYLANMTEFDLINSFHLHGNFFDVYRTGTRLTPGDYTDTIMLCQGERAILEITFPYTGQYMFHAHQSEFAELGWMSFFDVVEDDISFAGAPAVAAVCDLPPLGGS